MQRGTILKHHGSWVLRYYDVELRNGIRVRKKAFRKLAPIGPDYPIKRSVLLIADKILSPINSGQLQPESAMALTAFIEKLYLSHAAKALRPSTVKGYHDIYNLHLKHRLNGIRIRDFRTVHGQRLMAQIPNVGHKTLLRIKSFLSGALTYALREGVLDGHNPMHSVSVPGRAKKFKGLYYTIQEISDMAQLLEHPALAVVSTAAFAGLRLSELRGLRWSDYDGTKLDVSRSVWRTHVGDTKTEDSAASVPVLPILAKILNAYRVLVNGKDNQYIFAGKLRGAPLNLHNLANRTIKPILAANGIPWKGWHAFRRGLASNLYDVGVKPKVIQAILRHSDIGTTLAYYVETPDQESRKALAKIEDWIMAVE